MNETKNIFRQKLSNHQISLDDSFWADMEKRLNQNERKKTITHWWYIGGIAASFALLFTLASLFQSKDKNLSITGFMENTTTETFVKNNMNEPVSENNIIVITEKKSFIVECRDVKKDELFSQEIPFATEDTTQIAETIPENNIKNISIAKKIAKIEAFKKETKQEIKSEKRQPFSLALAANFIPAGTGGRQKDMLFADIDADSRDIKYYGFLNEKINSDRLVATNDVANNEKTIEELLQDYHNEKHLPPLSVGVSIRKNFNRYFGVETGIVYTYLRSTLNKTYTWGWDNSWSEYDHATLTQHYIGIPLNAVVNIVDKKWWNFYFSLGGMVEKGIWLDFQRTCTFSYSTEMYNQNLQQKISGVQWSVAAALGASFKFYNNFSLYFEPKFNYYFDCKQPRSFRTMSPFNIGINAGIRYEL